MFIMQPVNDLRFSLGLGVCSLTHMIDEATCIALVPGIVHILIGVSNISIELGPTEGAASWPLIGGGVENVFRKPIPFRRRAPSHVHRATLDEAPYADPTLPHRLRWGGRGIRELHRTFAPSVITALR